MWRHAVLLQALHAGRQDKRRPLFLRLPPRARLHLLGRSMHLGRRRLERQRLLQLAQLVGVNLLELRHVGVLLRTALLKLELLLLRLVHLVKLHKLLPRRCRRFRILRGLPLALHLGRARLLRLRLSLLLFLEVPRVLLLLLRRQHRAHGRLLPTGEVRAAEWLAGSEATGLAPAKLARRRWRRRRRLEQRLRLLSHRQRLLLLLMQRADRDLLLLQCSGRLLSFLVRNVRLAQRLFRLLLLGLQRLQSRLVLLRDQHRLLRTSRLCRRRREG
jgi:hypothetical protein